MIEQILFGTVYINKLEKDLKFYEKILRLEKLTSLGSNKILMNLDGEEGGLYIEAGYQKHTYKENSSRFSLTFHCNSVIHLFERLRKYDVHLLHNEPQDMGNQLLWFAGFDFSGNIVEFLGNKEPVCKECPEEKVFDIAFGSIYCSDYEKNLKLYTEALGLEKSFDIEENSCFLKFANGSDALYVNGNAGKRNFKENIARSSIIFGTHSVFKTFDNINKTGVQMIHSEPQDIGDGDYWFMFKDFSGNIIEILGEPE